MKFVPQRFEILDCPDGDEILKKIERAGRTCYKSEERITTDSAVGFVRGLVRRGHLSVIEHVNVSVKIVCNRGTSHQIVRHRLAAYSQESSYYCNYGGTEIQFIRPAWMTEDAWPLDETIREDSPRLANAVDVCEAVFVRSCLDAEKAYNGLLLGGWNTQQAREVLPNAVKTELIMTANLREWRHVFRMRCAMEDHVQIRVLMRSGLRAMSKRVPVLFDDLAEEFLT